MENALAFRPRRGCSLQGAGFSNAERISKERRTADATISMKRVFQHPPAPASGRRYWRSTDELADTPEFREWLEREFPSSAAQLNGDEWSRRSFLKLMGLVHSDLGGHLDVYRHPRNFPLALPSFHSLLTDDRDERSQNCFAGIRRARRSSGRNRGRPTLMLFIVPVQGVLQAAVNWWYANNLLFLWFGSLALGTAYYMGTTISIVTKHAIIVIELGWSAAAVVPDTTAIGEAPASGLR